MPPAARCSSPGSMGPTGEIMAPHGPLTIEAAADMFEEQARGLLAGGADLLWVETISAPDEYRAAALGIARTGAPWCGTMSFDTAGRTMMGLTAADLVAAGRGAAVPAAGVRRQLRGRGLGPAAHRARLPGGAPEPAGDRQGQRRHPEVRRGPHPLRRHPGADGRLRGAGPRLRRPDHRRLLRHHARASGGDARRARDHAAGAGAGPRHHRRPARRLLLGLRRLWRRDAASAATGGSRRG